MERRDFQTKYIYIMLRFDGIYARQTHNKIRKGVARCRYIAMSLRINCEHILERSVQVKTFVLRI